MDMTDSKGGVKVLGSTQSTGPTSNPVMQSKDADLTRFAQTFGPNGSHEIVPKPSNMKSAEGLKRNFSFDQIWLDGQQNVGECRGSGSGIQVSLVKEIFKHIGKDETDRAVPNDKDKQIELHNLLKHGSLAEIQARSGDLKFKPLSPILNRRQFTVGPIVPPESSEGSLRRNVSFDDKMLHRMKQGGLHGHHHGSLLTELLKHQHETLHTDELAALPEEPQIGGSGLLGTSGAPKADMKPLTDAPANTKWNWFGVVKKPTAVLSGSQSAVDLTNLSRQMHDAKENTGPKKVETKRVTVRELNYVRPF